MTIWGFSFTLQDPEILPPETEQWEFLSYCSHFFASAFSFTDILYREGKRGEE